MKVCIVGAGAIGGFLGVRLALSGHEVTAIARGATAQAIQRNGWRLESDGQAKAAIVRVCPSASTAGAQDVIVIALKGHSLPDIAASLKPMIGPSTIVVPAINGIPWWFFQDFGGNLKGTRLEAVDPDGAISAAIPASSVIGCVVQATCSTPSPGMVRHGFGNRLIFGEPGGGVTERVGTLAACFRSAGFDVEVSQRIQADVWFKLWGNMTHNPVSALTGATCDQILQDPLVRDFCVRAMGEAAEIGEAIGCPISQTAEERNAQTATLGAFKTSMLQDLEAGRPLEISGILGSVRELAQRIGHPTPTIDALLGLVRLMAKTRGIHA